MQERSDKMPSTDLRVQRTKKVLKDQFKEMFLKMDYEKITIKELCEKAMINRRTFYLHYNSIDDILSEILEEMAEEFLEYTKDYDHFANPQKIVRDYFIFTNERPLFEKLNNNLDYNYLREAINRKVRHNGKQNFESALNYDEFTTKILATFLNSATVSMYKLWCEEGKKQPMEEVIKTAAQLIENGISSMVKEDKEKIS